MTNGHLVTNASILLIPVAPLSVCVCVCVYVCVTYLLRDHWTDLVHIWGDDRYNTDGWPRLGLVTLGQRSRSPGRSRSPRKKIFFLKVREIWRAAKKNIFFAKIPQKNLTPIFFSVFQKKKYLPEKKFFLNVREIWWAAEKI